MDYSKAQTIVGKYVGAWNSTSRDPMWVILATPGDSINIPNVTFGNHDSVHAGMELPVRAQLIVLNKAMRPESLLSTFLHEYGHALYRVENPNAFNHIESEIFAIRHSLQALEAEGCQDLACQEAQTVIQMASAEPYRSAVERLQDDQLWRKYSERRL